MNKPRRCSRCVSSSESASGPQRSAAGPATVRRTWRAGSAASRVCEGGSSLDNRVFVGLKHGRDRVASERRRSQRGPRPMPGRRLPASPLQLHGSRLAEPASPEEERDSQKRSSHLSLPLHGQDLAALARTLQRTAGRAPWHGNGQQGPARDGPAMGCDGPAMGCDGPAMGLHGRAGRPLVFCCAWPPSTGAIIRAATRSHTLQIFTPSAQEPHDVCALRAAPLLSAVAYKDAAHARAELFLLLTSSRPAIAAPGRRRRPANVFASAVSSSSPPLACSRTDTPSPTAHCPLPADSRA
ncbi:hypothetical protein P154DRAFT_576879 [Amniculicola lignicola CBS 123094]|uniref:Uncharacterized protein n=1 Tax=Amniculicola lignicola CBS 123094 TaxID=1392246 RepID=A0A6A5WF68_9PLEO|nr:hypothetical protein P154DRAFT_576879 [Amniculicola lignicola CBS 123094]